MGLYMGSEQWVVGKVKVSSLVGVGASHTHGTLLSHIMTKIVFFVFFSFHFFCLFRSLPYQQDIVVLHNDYDCSICVFSPLNFTPLFGSLTYPHNESCLFVVWCFLCESLYIMTLNSCLWCYFVAGFVFVWTAAPIHIHGTMLFHSQPLEKRKWQTTQRDSQRLSTIITVHHLLAITDK